jgi:Domain of unknown function (DUF6429)
MNIDTEKIRRSRPSPPVSNPPRREPGWKSFDWDTMNRLHAKGFISNPIGKAKSVLFTDVGLRESERLFEKLFARRQS